VSAVPRERVRALNDRPVQAEGRFVLYWMTAFRRTRSNFALQHALERARELEKPLVVLEPLRVGYEHACDRFHRFVLDGMADNAAACARAGVTYYPYVEPKRGAGRGLLAALARDAALVVGDDWPCFFLPRMLAAAGKRLAVRLEAVDACGVLPLSAAAKAFPTAYAFRRFLQKTLRPHLEASPTPEPLQGGRLPRVAALSKTILARWPAATQALLAGEPGTLASLPIAHAVAPTGERGGAQAGARALKRFVAGRLARYAERNEPASEVTSALSPYLHFGHIGPHEVLKAVLAAEDWSPALLSDRADGHRAGWWGVSPAAEGFLDQLVTWRELGFVANRYGPPPTSLEALPAWSQRTLEEHASDPREHVYNLKTFERAATHDPLWNAAQRQLVREGRLHNYMRMLWGKKILEWSASPAEALGTLLTLNDRYALDGRDPNSTNGILWVLGRFDRPWGPERQVFGSVRYMSSANTARKLDVGPYLERYGAGPATSRAGRRIPQARRRGGGVRTRPPRSAPDADV